MHGMAGLKVVLEARGYASLLSTPEALGSFPSTGLMTWSSTPVTSALLVEAEGSGTFKVLRHTVNSGSAQLHETLSKELSHIQKYCLTFFRAVVTARGSVA